eukprot:TRINITY_DN1075_c0_g1_i1.p1 TRINITY_DN1075_c0_g1~~TRINITY_DN1075_c0_g1_i1.p1  ORF type:complete len:607 (+),score=221.61 TRINITY_DN1075_c0_g1_i1:865-2685(+)
MELDYPLLRVFIAATLLSVASANTGAGNKDIVEVLIWSGADGAGYLAHDVLRTPNYLGHDVHKDEWKCPIDCRFTADRSRVGLVDGVLFEAQPITSYYDDYKRDPPQFPNKFPHQYWINNGYEQENYFHLYGDPGYLDYIDINMTFMLHSQVPITFMCDWGGVGHNVSQFLKPPPPKYKDKGIVAMITNCGSGGAYMRIDYLHELMQYVKIDSYGQCLHNKDMPDDMRFPIYSDHGSSMRNKVTVFRDYKFVITFENNNVTDYVTEKMCNVLQAGAVPIYMGAPNVHPDWTPGEKSIIQTDNFKGPQDLAKHLQFLLDNDEEYYKYFDWKKRGLSWQFQQRYADCEFYGAECRLCKYILGRRLQLQHTQLEELERRKATDHKLLALEFNGDNYVEIPSSWQFDLKDQFTFGAWVRPSRWASGTLLSRGTLYRWGLKHIWKRLYVELCVHEQCFLSGLSVSPENWSYISVTYRYEQHRPGRVTFFFNGGKDKVVNDEPSVPLLDKHYAVVSRSIAIGTNADRTDSFAGQLDDVSVWNAAMTDREQRALVYRIASIADKGLVAFYSFNQEPGPSVHDLGFHKLNGTTVGGLFWPNSSTKPLTTSNPCL